MTAIFEQKKTVTNLPTSIKIASRVSMAGKFKRSTGSVFIANMLTKQKRINEKPDKQQEQDLSSIFGH